MSDVKKEVEAILFAAGRTVTINEFQMLLDMKSPGLIKEAIKDLIAEYDSNDRPLMIVAENDGWKLTVREKFLHMVRRINPHTELSKTILETLSVVAWKHPVLQSEVIRIRTNKAYDHLSELERLGFILKEKHGRSFMIKVTQKFLDYFDLPDNKAMKEVFKDFKDMEVAVQKKMDDFEKTVVAPESAPVQEAGAGVKLEEFSDTLPEMKKPKAENELEVYDLPKEEVQKEQVKEQEEEKRIEEEEEQQIHEETPEEKTRRIARELLAEEDVENKDEEETLDERKLHPKLEEFVAGTVISKRTKAKEVKKSVEKTGKPEPEEKEAAQETDTEGNAEDEDDDSPKPAEEYPGQFS